MFEMQLTEFPVFFSYLWAKKRMDMFTHLIISFILPTLPYIFISWKVLQRPLQDQISFFGDGSMISLCIGIICVYFWKTHDFKNDRQKSQHKLFNVLAVIIYIILIVVFMECQLSTPRSIPFIITILIVSILVMMITILISLIITFDDYPDFQNYKESISLKKAESNTQSPAKSKTKIEI